MLAGEDEPETLWFIDALEECLAEVEGLLRIIADEADTEGRRQQARDALEAPPAK
jgi:hypothetical protein